MTTVLHNPIQVLGGIQSEEGKNTTTTALAADATFTGEWEQNHFPDVMVSCFSNVAGTLYFDFSVNGTDARTFPSNGFKVAAGIHEFHVAVKGARYFRVRLVNGSTEQTTFQLYTYYGQFAKPNAPLNQTLGSDSDALTVRTYPTMVDLALGKLGGIVEKDKFGYAPGLGTSIQLGSSATWVDLWAYGGQRTSPTTTFMPYMASTSSADQDIDITWTYLDANGDEQTVTVATNASDGRTPVSLGVTAQEVYRGKNNDSTLLQGNVACVIENDFTNGVPDEQDEVLAYITPNDQQTQVLAFRIPANKYGIITHISLLLARANGSAGAADITLDIRETGKVWRTIRPYQITTSSAPLPPELITLNPLTDVRVRIRDVSDANSAITGKINYLVVDQ